MSSKREKTRLSKENRFFKPLLIAGVAMVFVSFVILSLTFYRVLFEETRYSLKKFQRNVTVIKPVDREFGIVIPKISANARVISNVDPFDSKKYQVALTKGVAHALGSGYPGNAGNTFIFAHSSRDWYTANQYNSVFYLLYKLEKGDKIEMYYKNKRYIYEVTVKKFVEASEVSYLNSFATENTSILTLMTCWPPGTTLKRLIIQARISDTN